MQTYLDKHDTVIGVSTNETADCKQRNDENNDTEIILREKVCGNNWIRRIVGVKRADKRRLDELRVEV